MCLRTPGLAKEHGRVLDEARKRQSQKLNVMLARLGEAGTPKPRRSILNSSSTPTVPGKLLQMRQPGPQRAQRGLSVHGPLSAGHGDHDDCGPEYSSAPHTPQSARSPFRQLSDACE